jgi:hypothetical protein
VQLAPPSPPDAPPRPAPRADVPLSLKEAVERGLFGVAPDYFRESVASRAQFAAWVRVVYKFRASIRKAGPFSTTFILKFTRDDILAMRRFAADGDVDCAYVLALHDGLAKILEVDHIALWQVRLWGGRSGTTWHVDSRGRKKPHACRGCMRFGDGGPEMSVGNMHLRSRQCGCVLQNKTAFTPKLRRKDAH